MGSTPATHSKSVVLPDPFGPMSPRISPRRTVNPTSLRAVSRPYVFQRPLTVTKSTNLTGALPLLPCVVLIPTSVGPCAHLQGRWQWSLAYNRLMSQGRAARADDVEGKAALGPLEARVLEALWTRERAATVRDLQSSF